jgi:RNA polymerase sigma-70 factor (ECF subfamily)
MNTTPATGAKNVKNIENADAEGLFRKYGPMVFRRCQQILGNADEAADAAQEVFVKVIDNKNTLTAEYPSSLLWRMATNHSLNLLQSRVCRGGGADGESLLERIACSRDVEAQIGSRGVLQKLFRRHPESSRTIAVLHLVDGMTLEETAREVKMSVSGVRKRLRMLREDLVELNAI